MIVPGSVHAILVVQNLIVSYCCTVNYKIYVYAVDILHQRCKISEALTCHLRLPKLDGFIVKVSGKIRQLFWP